MAHSRTARRSTIASSAAELGVDEAAVRATGASIGYDATMAKAREALRQAP